MCPATDTRSPHRPRLNRMNRPQLIEELADRITSIARTHPLRVAIDGVDAAGKSTLADELIQPIQERTRPVIRASIDGFHNPTAIRYRRGRDSPEGHYHDSFDYEALKSNLLSPLEPNGRLRYRSRVFDHQSNSPLHAKSLIAERNSVLLFDGIFLQRPEIAKSWDYIIFLVVDFSVSVERAELRDSELMGGVEAVRDRYAERYIPGQRVYLECCLPCEKADSVVNNNDPANPWIERVRVRSATEHT